LPKGQKMYTLPQSTIWIVMPLLVEYSGYTYGVEFMKVAKGLFMDRPQLKQNLFTQQTSASCELFHSSLEWVEWMWAFLNK